METTRNRCNASGLEDEERVPLDAVNQGNRSSLKSFQKGLQLYRSLFLPSETKSWSSDLHNCKILCLYYFEPINL